MTAARSRNDARYLELLEAERLHAISQDLHRYCRYIDIPGVPVDPDDPDCERFYPDNVTPAAHHDLLNSALMRLADDSDPLNRLMVFMPPGSAKSTYGTVTFPTWYMGNHPGEPVICASYGSDLARKFGRKCRQIVSSSDYQRLFGTTLEAHNRAADDWALTNGASYMCGGILSGMTGNRAKLLVMDDPVQGREQADSPTIRDKTWDAYQDDLATRLKPGGLQLVIQTRWHEDDMSGRILPETWDGESGWITSRQGDRWYVICLEAECTRHDDPLGRQIGEYLWTDYKPASEWESEKRKGSRRWASLYQQRPRPQEGGLIHRSWVRRYQAPPAEFSRIVQSWDTAYKDKEINDPSVCTTWGETRSGYYLLDVFRARMVYPDVKRAVISHAMRWEPNAVLIEDKASGQALIQELRQGTDVGGERRTPPVIAVDPKGVNKIDRLVAVSSIFEGGQVFLPESAPWLVDFEMELFAFPLSTHDDQVDSTSQFLAWAHKTRVRVDYHAVGARRVGLTAHDDSPAGDDLDLGTGGNTYGGFM
jgi:predicted phage terminase large subunit-like protein